MFQPEYLGETTAHVFGNMAEREFVVLGGKPEAIAAAADFYTNCYNSMVRFYFCDAMTAEVCKYMENAFYAVKVTFVCLGVVLGCVASLVGAFLQDC